MSNKVTHKIHTAASAQGRDMMRDQADALGVAIGKTATYSGAGSMIVFGLSLYELGVIVGMVTGVIGLFVQWHFNRRRDRREALEHAARMERLRDEWESAQR